MAAAALRAPLAPRVRCARRARAPRRYVSARRSIARPARAEAGLPLHVAALCAVVASALGGLLAAAVTPGGRALMREFMLAEEAGYAKNLVVFMGLFLAVLFIGGGSTAVLRILPFATLVLPFMAWVQRGGKIGIPGPRQARARVLAHERKVPYAQPPPEAAEAAFRDAFPHVPCDEGAGPIAAVSCVGDIAVFLVPTHLCCVGEGGASMRAVPLADVRSAEPTDAGGVIVSMSDGTSIALEPTEHTSVPLGELVPVYVELAKNPPPAAGQPVGSPAPA